MEHFSYRAAEKRCMHRMLPEQNTVTGGYSQ
jgi:hypothetical protein